MDERAYLKVKIKSLAEEARIIRNETKKAKLHSIKNGLYLHRIGVVRSEARHTHLAYGFLRGRSYEQLEQKAKVAPDWKKVRKMVEKYGAHYDAETHGWMNAYDIQREERAEALKRFDTWTERASASFEKSSGENS